MSELEKKPFKYSPVRVAQDICEQRERIKELRTRLVRAEEHLWFLELMQQELKDMQGE